MAYFAIKNIEDGSYLRGIGLFTPNFTTDIRGAYIFKSLADANNNISYWHKSVLNNKDLDLAPFPKVKVVRVSIIEDGDT